MSGFFYRLLGLGTDQPAHIVGTELTLRGGLSLGWAIALAIVLAAWIVWLYRRAPGGASRFRRLLMASLRVLFLATLLAVLLRPVLAFTLEGSVRQSLVVLVDSTGSMKVRDLRSDANDLKRAALASDLLNPKLSLKLTPEVTNQPSLQMTRLEMVQKVFANKRLKLLESLGKDYDLSPFSFGTDVTDLSGKTKDAEASPSAFLSRIDGSRPATAIGDSVNGALARKRGQPLAGVLLVTDGQSNSGTPPVDAAAAARQDEVPLYIYGVGVSAPRDIIVEKIFARETAFIDDEMAVTVLVRGQGLGGQNAHLVLTLDGNQVAEKDIVFSSDETQAVSLKFAPQKVGQFDLEARIDPRSDEVSKDNNSTKQRLKVVDNKIKVLLIEQKPRWEFKYIETLLYRDRRVDLKSILFEGDPGISKGEKSPYLAEFPAKKEDLLAYDLVILGDVDPAKIKPEQFEQLREFVSKFGGALIVLGGSAYMPEAYHKTPLEDMLPIELSGVSDLGVSSVNDKPIHLELTPAGKTSPMMRVAETDEESAQRWTNFPPVYFLARVGRAKPAAEVLVVDGEEGHKLGAAKPAAIASQQYGMGQVLFIGTDNLWRWRKNAGDYFHARLWGQMVQRMAMSHLLGASKRTQLLTDKETYNAGDRVTVYARLFDETFKPVTDPTIKGFYLQGSEAVTAPVRNPGPTGTAIPLRMMPDQPGMYRGEFIASAPGNCQFYVERDPATRRPFTVKEGTPELGQTAMNESLLREMASVSGGAFFREEDLSKLVDTISHKSEKIQTTSEVEIWSSPICFLLMLAAVSGEWILRKRSQLK
jgi:hypothetical protein